ncbi:hypothetical protein KSP39_PZI006771 [Platanthera zijinensis]|uniref:Uncharacterized protein n=1 Tax=Platanthera zijinensis TaxID=2320716 RepID=A0AAP0BPA9_9ASPA
MAIPLLLCPPFTPPHRNPTLTSRLGFGKGDFPCRPFSRRAAIIELAAATLSLTSPASANLSSPPNAPLDGISSTKSWSQFFGDGFSIRIPPLFQDINEPEVRHMACNEISIVPFFFCCHRCYFFTIS